MCVISIDLTIEDIDNLELPFRFSNKVSLLVLNVLHLFIQIFRFWDFRYRFIHRVASSDI